ncbi:aminotransferase class I/II-fold pyridoxal phosphate-dependent enzyme [Kribbella sp. NBC_00359]|uniref:aminotransferase class I/II-fold pyridoxal phosphate-dependent enzyme n=1 Tax=Kribbella sp. NBC_00359 TaxID=2975966 RepID=UPI002E20B8CE
MTLVDAVVDRPVSRQTSEMIAAAQPQLEFLLASSRWAQRNRSPDGADFVAGNPQSVLPGYVQALESALTPRDDHWFGYKVSEATARRGAAAALRERRGSAYEADDIVMTNGAMAGLLGALRTVVDPGDEVIFFKPSWFFYQALITACSAVAVPVMLSPPAFDLDLDRLRAAITPRTRAVIINSPNNPTGRIYPAEALITVGQLLTEAASRHGRAIFLISDEAYSRIVFDRSAYPSPAEYYENSFLVYTYGKTLLTPGERLGYVALPPTMPHRAELRAALIATLFLCGYAFPDAVLQRALPDLEQLCLDLGALQRRRDRLVTALREQGYVLAVPEGAFYLLPKCPIPDDVAFADYLAQQDVYVLPGSLVDLPGYFRLSLTASEEMIERGLPIFRKAMDLAPALISPAQTGTY